MSKTILVKVVLTAIPLYQLSALLAPKYFMHQLRIYIRKFLWEGGKQETKKNHLVNWKIVRAPKQHGGLGFRDPSLVNLAMTIKIFWKFDKWEDQWWVKVLQAKYQQ